MKLCEKCGTPQKDENFRCVECGSILPGKVRHLWVYSVVRSVIYHDRNNIFFLDFFSYVNTPGRITTIVMSKLFTVKIKICRAVSAVDFNKMLCAVRQIAF